MENRVFKQNTSIHSTVKISAVIQFFVQCNAPRREEIKEENA
jgi:hypothetical protein